MVVRVERLVVRSAFVQKGLVQAQCVDSDSDDGCFKRETRTPQYMKVIKCCKTSEKNTDVGES